jgi:hypothetical protein
VLLNNFVANTTSFFNAFSETVEKRISSVSSKITDLETLLAVLEAKLNSVPDLESIEVVPPPAQTAPAVHTTATTAPVHDIAPLGEPSAAPIPPAEAATATVDANMCPVSEHPDYSAFFKLLKVGVPPFVVQAKIVAAGLDGSMIDTPDRLVPK